MENRSHALLAGLFTLCFVLATAFVLWWFAAGHEDSQTLILETRGNVTGLNLEAQVRYRGIRAGKVRDIRPDPADPEVLLVEIILAREYPMTDRTIARLNYQGVTGLAYVMLEEGKAGKGVPLDVDGPVPPRLQIQPGLFSTLGDKAGDIASQVAELTQRLNRLLDDRNVQNISRTLDNLATASEGFKEVPQLMADLRAVLSASNRQRLSALLAHLEKTVGEAAPMTAELRGVIATLNTAAQRVGNAGSSVTVAGDRLSVETLPRVEALVGEVNGAMRRLDRLLDTLNETPQAVLFGATPARPGPGEKGFASPEKSHE